MQTDVHPIAHLIARVVGTNGDQELLEVQVIINRALESEPISSVPQTELLSRQQSHTAETSRKDSPYINPFTTNLSDDNKRGLENLIYWSYGRRRSKTYILNQALAQYLAQYQESSRPFPREEG